MRKLTELQLAVLAAVRDGEVRPFVNHKIARFIGFTPIGHLHENGSAELAQHPEF